MVGVDRCDILSIGAGMPRIGGRVEMTGITDVPDVATIPYLPLTSRPRIRWPNDARVALWVVPNIEHYQYEPAPHSFMRPWPRVPQPDVAHYSYYDYGNRV